MDAPYAPIRCWRIGRGRRSGNVRPSHPGVMGAIILFVLSSCLDLAAQSASDRAAMPLPPGVGIQIEAKPRIATIGDLIQVDLDISMPSGYQAEIPRYQWPYGDFTIIDFFPGPDVPEDGGMRKSTQPSLSRSEENLHHRARIIAAFYKTGSLAFPPVRINLKTRGGGEMAVSSPSVSITIRSVLPRKNQELKDLKKQADIQEPTRWALWIAIALACCILGVIAWSLWRRRRRRPLSLPSMPAQDPLDLAGSELRDLLRRGMPDRDTVKQFYVFLSEIVKRILESGYKIHTAEQTTSEIIDALRSCPALETENTAQIESFLIRCDVVKFAKYFPSKAEHETAASDALSILANVRKAVISG